MVLPGLMVVEWTGQCLVIGVAVAMMGSVPLMLQWRAALPLRMASSMRPALPR